MQCKDWVSRKPARSALSPLLKDGFRLAVLCLELLYIYLQCSVFTIFSWLGDFVRAFVFNTPEQTPTEGSPDCAIAVDVLRATTTIATAFEAGIESVRAFSDLDALLQASERYPSDKRLRAGERGGKKVDGYDLGNSPLEYLPEIVCGRHLFLSTTNGTRALECIRHAPIVLTAALTNRQTVVEYLLKNKPETIWIVGSGWQGGYSLEDTVCAGAIVDRLGLPLADVAGNDEAIAAVALYRQWQNDLHGLVHLASHGQRLLRLDRAADLEYCSRTDILPIQGEPGVLVKHASEARGLNFVAAPKP